LSGDKPYRIITSQRGWSQITLRAACKGSAMTFLSSRLPFFRIQSHRTNLPDPCTKDLLAGNSDLQRPAEIAIDDWLTITKEVLMIDAKSFITNEIGNDFDELAVPLSNKKMRKADAGDTRKARKEAKFTARLNQDDFAGMKRMAIEKGIPYQTLLGHIIHLYVERKLIDVTEVQKLFELKKIG
jgi:predicted DNA binding CopG/RHH family protein